MNIFIYITSHYEVVIIGGGILGCSLAYFLASQSKSSIMVIEQEKQVAMHTSSRNTGKVHSPFYYDPDKRSSSARAALKGFEMIKQYCELNHLPFREDGVLEVATSDSQLDTLHKYLKWGYGYGMDKNQLAFLDKDEVAKIEPNVKCESALLCYRDGSTDYGLITKQLVQDSQKFGCSFSFDNKFRRIIYKNGKLVINCSIKDITANYIINVAGGHALDIAHSMSLASEFHDLHFRGEYWIAPERFINLTKMSVYSVPKYTIYPFLDPHWIVRVNGTREVGPNAVPVFGPYAYNWQNNLKIMLPKMVESSRIGIIKTIMNRDFLQLASSEFLSSLSKRVMINRVKEFLPDLIPSAFIKRGTSGIRSSLIDRFGVFFPDTLKVKNDYSLHILNYNSPGATGALPIAASLAKELFQDGHILLDDEFKALWNVNEVAI